MPLRTVGKSFWRLIFFLIAIWGTNNGPAHALSIGFTLDTSSLFGTNANLAFDFIDGAGVNNNTAIISNFLTNGTLGSASSLGGVSGSLATSLNITDTVFFNELLQGINLGNSLSFTLDLTSNFAGGIPDAFSFFILNDAALSSLVTTDLLGDALFTTDINGTVGGILSVASLTNPNIGVTASLQLPEPDSLLLLMSGIVLLLLALRLPSTRANIWSL